MHYTNYPWPWSLAPRLNLVVNVPATPRLFRVVLQMVAFQLDELIKPISAQRDPLA